MKKLIAFLLISLTSSVQALPNCPSHESEPYTYNNCFSTTNFPDGGNYFGEWKDGKFHGHGNYSFPDEGNYVGEWKEGRKEGNGTFTWESGNKYVGEWKDDQHHGLGTYINHDGRNFSGYFMNGEFVPDICDGKGLVKATSEFEQCLLELINKL